MIFVRPKTLNPRKLTNAYNVVFVEQDFPYSGGKQGGSALVSGSYLDLRFRVYRVHGLEWFSKKGGTRFPPSTVGTVGMCELDQNLGLKP